ncbi:hypothetical protein [Beijerinckia sp. L45]|uniref:hypothetical protein n=1 Tax=Beijerinckia sp. L45 TaxID=1641855 RepID=UPI00131C1379|nr:hypothetical protein [Beijerinckia sp. L45]
MSEEADDAEQDSGKATAPKLPPASRSAVQARIVDGRPPFPDLFDTLLAGVPRPGDNISIPTSAGAAGYKVQWVNWDPRADVQVTIGCLPNQTVDPPTAMSAADVKQRIEDLTKSNLQIFEKAEAYTKAIILAGYAGLFGLWSFAQTSLTPREIDIVAVLLGVSLISFVTWEIFVMRQRAITHAKFNQIVDATPESFFTRLSKFEEGQRVKDRSLQKIWVASFYLSVLPGYAAALLLIYNVGAHLLSLPHWP